VDDRVWLDAGGVISILQFTEHQKQQRSFTLGFFQCLAKFINLSISNTVLTVPALLL